MVLLSMLMHPKATASIQTIDTQVTIIQLTRMRGMLYIPPFFEEMMKTNIYSGNFAEQTIRYTFRHPETELLFRGFIKQDSESYHAMTIPYEDSLFWFKDPRLVDDANTEYCMSIYRTSDELLKNHRCIFHAAAILWQGKAWLFTGDSGVGKTTQLKNWLELYKDEMIIMNGDKPVLRYAEGGNIIVCPSPWKGKEGWGDDTIVAPLGGFIFLKQGEINKIERAKKQDVMVKMMTMIFSTFSDQYNVRYLCRMTELLLSSADCWILVNKGDLESSQLAHDYILEEIKNGNGTAKRCCS